MDVYEVIGVGDSLVRERLFEALADVTHYDYDTIYLSLIHISEPTRP